MALADNFKSGRQSTPQDRMDNNMVENIKSSLEQSKVRYDLSQRAQDYLDHVAGKQTARDSVYPDLKSNK